MSEFPVINPSVAIKLAQTTFQQISAKQTILALLHDQKNGRNIDIFGNEVHAGNLKKTLLKLLIKIFVNKPTRQFSCEMPVISV